jgi:hypothetical protein
MSSEQSLSDTPRAPLNLQLVVTLLLLLSVMIGAQTRDLAAFTPSTPFREADIRQQGSWR